MNVQMYLMIGRGAHEAERSRELQIAVRERGGFILMVTQNGPIVALDDDEAEAFKRHALVESVHPITLNPSGLAADRLQAIFAENLRRQLQPVQTNITPDTTHEESP